MKEILIYKNVSQLIVAFSSIFFNEEIRGDLRISLFTCEDERVIKVFEGPVWLAKGVGNYLLIQSKEGSMIDIYSGKLEKAKVLEGRWYLDTTPNNNNHFIKLRLKEENVKRHFFIDSELTVKEFKLDYKLCAKNHLININLKNLILCYNEHEVLIWQSDISLYGIYKEQTDLGLIEYPNSIDREIFCDHDSVYIPLKGGQLLALNINDGSLRWMLEMEHSGFYAIHENRIYKISNWHLYEIDALSGKIIKSIKDSDLINHARPYFTQDFKVYADYILLKNQIAGWVAMIDRVTFTLNELIEIGSELASTADIMHWHNNKLYVLDMNNTLHIYKK